MCAKIEMKKKKKRFFFKLNKRSLLFSLARLSLSFSARVAGKLGGVLARFFFLILQIDIGTAAHQIPWPFQQFAGCSSFLFALLVNFSATKVCVAVVALGAFAWATCTGNKTRRRRRRPPESVCLPLDYYFLLYI